MKLQHLLVIIDPSREDQPALTRARWIAQRCGARLELLACEYNPALDNALLLERGDLDTAQRNLLDERLAWLQQLAAPLRGAGLDVHCQVRWGKSLHHQVLLHCEQSTPDLVLKSAHHHNLLKRLFLTNNDWQLIRHCPQPLWLVQHGEWAGKNLCAAVDPLHAGDAPAALDHQLITVARELEQRLQLDAHYLHAYMALPHTLAFNAELLANYDNYVLRTEAHHREAFDALLAHYPQIDRQRTLLGQGFAEEVIPAYVKDHAIDLLLMGAVARGQLDNALIGQTAERVFEEVECDLLVIRPPETAT
ncbi:universal stress protein [Pseudomonas nicosulfuronedens]|uniref:Universal stress protein UspA n=1 Tax=Pseudomonas nicosulfuronedens TaxID=2571105 RepID=A0A5R9RA15_9PSED|nr:universal stress protein [Pseudomonas nicosulfuronedens]MDH1009725.1 universal stress protein [Pseudomonas nicosulfuronedens]MDH1982390.1 universal stress protein [Pseudomonas nicosulfuronedens]MDH2027715.1 universal stress protein [Pseudomonas nicosulfuronedens]TLX78622.1 universal stress protein UspA [Pseudomonas nicosulfuronedens]